MRPHLFLIAYSFLAMLFLLNPSQSVSQQSSTTQDPVVYYDMTGWLQRNLNDPATLKRFWEETQMVVSLQGIVNRDVPRLFIRYNEAPDDFWWNYLKNKDGWFVGRQILVFEELAGLLKHFRSFYNGLVMWDERVPSTSNLASSIAGMENLLCISNNSERGSLQEWLKLAKLDIPVQKKLMADDGSPLFTGKGIIPQTNLTSTGSAKCDAYLWLVENYVKTKKANPFKCGYYIDSFWQNGWKASGPLNHTLTNHDYVIAKKGIIFDLDIWDDEAPVDDPLQKPGTDAETFKKVIRSLYDLTQNQGMIHVAGFIPWANKYTNYKSNIWDAGSKHEAVPAEWRFAEILSCFNAYMDADALGTSSMANASFFQHYPLPDQIPQMPKPTLASMKKKGYINPKGEIAPKHYYSHYVGDYDSAAWLYWKLPSVWNDPKRGSIPLSWAFNPNLADRFPVGMIWARKLRSENDFFIAGDSGAGYLNPGYLSEPRVHSGLPSGTEVWKKHCLEYFKKWDITLTGFVIDGYARGLSKEGLDAYSEFSPDGIVAQKIGDLGVYKEMPFIKMCWDLPDDAKQAAQVLCTKFGKSSLDFKVFRSILKTPSWYVQVNEEVKALSDTPAEAIDMYSLMWLIRYQESNKVN